MYVELLPFRNYILLTTCFSAGKFCICLPLHVFAGVETAKKPKEIAKKRRNGEK